LLATSLLNVKDFIKPHRYDPLFVKSSVLRQFVCVVLWMPHCAYHLSKTTIFYQCKLDFHCT